MMKKNFVLLQGICILFLCVGCNENVGQSNMTSTSENPENEYAITYIIDEDNMPDFMWKPNGNYPKRYSENTEIKIDGLRHCRKDEHSIYAFEGWYYDEDYTNLVIDNIILDRQKGDLNLYAKIVERAKMDGDEVVASITYKWNDFGTIKEGIDSFPETMTSGISFPQEYVEGIGVALPDLHSTVYEFDGWCYDIACKNEVSRNAISADKTGNVIIYAALSIWID
jgi:uncharacterized repeat protein (TIGR02543 family)